jgi:hypothetical protein
MGGFFNSTDAGGLLLIGLIGSLSEACYRERSRSKIVRWIPQPEGLRLHPWLRQVP